MNCGSQLLINLGAMAHNLAVVRRIVGPHTALCPVLKADGYGLGAARLVARMARAGGDMFAVYTLAQAEELARPAVDARVLVLGPADGLDLTEGLTHLIGAGNLHLTVHGPKHLSIVARTAKRLGVRTPVHLEVDTGMRRGGCDANAAPAVLKRIVEHDSLHLAGVFTHFADAQTDPAFCAEQFGRFDLVLRQVAKYLTPECLIHAANSVATFRSQRYHCTMVRVGQAWAGYAGQGVRDAEFEAEMRDLRPILRWTSRIAHVKTVERGDTVGYRRTWTARRPTRIGLIPVGYADGYPPEHGSTDLEPKSSCIGLLVKSDKSMQRMFAPVVGAVNMDQMMVDLTDVARTLGDDHRSVNVGGLIELIGDDPELPNHLPTLAAGANASTHAMLARLNPRLPRTYVDDLSVETCTAPRRQAISVG